MAGAHQSGPRHPGMAAHRKSGNCGRDPLWKAASSDAALRNAGAFDPGGGVEANHVGLPRMLPEIPAPFPAKGQAGSRTCRGEASRARSRFPRRRIREHGKRCHHVVLAAGLLTAELAGAISAVTLGRTPRVGSTASIAAHVPGPAERGLLSMTIIDRKDIERSGIRYLSELLLSRSTFNAFGLHRAHFLGNGQTMFRWARPACL